MVEQFRVDQCFKPCDFGEVASCQLHFFSEASQLAYGAVAYLGMVNMHGKVHCSFVMGKSRLAPLKPMTIPRMELSAAVLFTRLDKLILDEIQYTIDSSVFWTDSMCVTPCREWREEVSDLCCQSGLCDSRAIVVETKRVVI